MSDAEDLKDKLANEMEAEMEQRDEGRLKVVGLTRFLS